jgi:ELWxxDGT repeat protein
MADENAYRVKDINTNLRESLPTPREVTLVDQTVFFVTDEVLSGRELWKTDGTGAGTELVLDIWPGVSYSPPSALTAAADRLFMIANDGVTGRELWTSDGTAAGTHLIIDSQPGHLWGNYSRFTPLRDELLFLVAVVGGGSAIYMRSDGTEEGTQPTPIIKAGQVGNQLFVSRWTSALGLELWMENPVDGSFVLVKDICPGSCSSSPDQLTDVDGTLFFFVGSQLWKSDGTEVGTVLVKETLAESPCGSTVPAATELTDVAGTLFFWASGRDLWKSDGTTAGTRLLKRFVWRDPAIYCSYYFEDLTLQRVVFQGKLIFSADDGISGQELWVSNGTRGMTVLLADIETGPMSSAPDDFAATPSTVVFSAYTSVSGREFWRTDGTGPGTVMVRDILPGADSSNADQFTAIGDTIVFSARPALGQSDRLWRTDGTDAGTEIITLPNPGTDSSRPEPFAAVGSFALLSADDGVHGRELWVTDGTDQGTSLIDLNLGAVGSEPDFFGPGFIFQGLPHFVADDGVHGSELWVSDGTPAGTSLFLDLLPGPDAGALRSSEVVGNKIFLSFDDGAIGTELWVSDGSEAGTMLVEDINPGSASSWPSGLTALGNQVLFSASDGATGRELWISDGTELGTYLLKDIQPGSAASSPVIEARLGNNIFFFADDGVSGVEPWISDGTVAGTHLIKDLGVRTVRRELTATDSLVFFSADDIEHGWELWATDGTAAGTHLVKDIIEGPGSSSPRGLFAFGSILLFPAPGGLWKSDGTEAGTFLMKAGVYATEFHEIGDLVYFNGADEAGSEVWLTDGTALGTQRLTDIAPGPSDSVGYGNRYLQLGSLVLFGATDLETASELWAIPLPESSPQLILPAGAAMLAALYRIRLRRERVPRGCRIRC